MLQRSERGTALVASLVTRAVAFAALVVLPLASPASAPTQTPPARFPARIEVVRVSVLVRGTGQPITGLDAAALEVEDNGVRQTVEQVSTEETPLKVVLALDVSGSVRGEALGLLKQACIGVIDGLRPADTAGLLTFAGSVRQVAPLGGDLAVLRRQVQGLDAGGGTALRDGAFAAMVLGDGAADGALGVVFTDGGESVSWLSEPEVLDAARRSRTVVYGVRIGDGATPFLGEVVRISGGRVLRPRSPRDLPRTFDEILQEFRTRYVLTYSPTGVARSGWHRVSVRLKGRPAVLTYREGYWVR
jgi:Ca-activated chloride channel family protein